MPTRARRICSRCRRAMPGSATRCPTCAARRQAAAPPSPYQTADWRRTSKAFIRANPACALCGKPSRIADHWPRSRKQLVADRVPDPDAWHRLRPLCRRCHDTETARLQPGGYRLRDD